MNRPVEFRDIDNNLITCWLWDLMVRSDGDGNYSAWVNGTAVASLGVHWYERLRLMILGELETCDCNS